MILQVKQESKEETMEMLKDSFEDIIDEDSDDNENDAQELNNESHSRDPLSNITQMNNSSNQNNFSSSIEVRQKLNSDRKRLHSSSVLSTTFENPSDLNVDATSVVSENRPYEWLRYKCSMCDYASETPKAISEHVSKIHENSKVSKETDKEF